MHVPPNLDKDQLRVVLENLECLEKQWDGEISEAQLRITSPALYLLIVDRQLEQVASSLGRKVRIHTPIRTQAVLEGDYSTIEFWQAGGGLSQGVETHGFQMFSGPMDMPKQMERMGKSKDESSKKTPVAIRKFGNLPAIIIRGIPVKNEELLKYVTDKLGGRHFDRNRRNRRLEEKYRILDGEPQKLALSGKNSVYFGLVTIGQLIVKSRDVQRLMAELRRLL